MLNPDPLDLIGRDLADGAVVELGGPRALVRRHRLGIFERAAGLGIGGGAGRVEHMAAVLDLETGICRAARGSGGSHPQPQSQSLAGPRTHL